MILFFIINQIIAKNGNEKHRKRKFRVSGTLVYTLNLEIVFIPKFYNYFNVFIPYPKVIIFSRLFPKNLLYKSNFKLITYLNP